MLDSPAHDKFPEDSAHRDYDIFEELPDGSTIWRGCEFGMANVESKLRELAIGSANKFFALSLQDRMQPVIRPFRTPAQHQIRRAS